MSVADPRSRGPFPPLSALVPHRPPACLLDQVVSYSGTSITCLAEVRDDHPLMQSPGLPAWALLEHLAQGAAALRGLEALDGCGSSSAHRPGYLVAVRDAHFSVSWLLPGEQLQIVLSLERRLSGMAVLHGIAYREGRPVCEATLSVHEG